MINILTNKKCDFINEYLEVKYPLKRRDKMSKKRNNGIPKDETPSERFVRLAGSRTNNVLANLNTLARTSRTPDYKYTKAQIDAIEKALTNKLIDVMGQFRGPTQPKGGFVL